MIVIPSLHGGGAERVAVTLADYWYHRGYDVVLVTQSEPSSDVYILNKNVTRISIHQLGKTGPLAQLKKVWAIRQIIKCYRPDVVIGMMTSASVLSILAATGLNIPVIATEHAYPPSQKISTLWCRLRQLSYPRAARVLALTEMSAQWIKKHITRAQVSVIPNAVQWPLNNTSPIIPVEKPIGTYLLLAVGRLHVEKGFDILIKAFSHITDHYPNWRLVILGEGEQRESLTTQIYALGLEQKVQLPGRIGNLRDWYAAADIFVLSSHNEGLSNSLQEAMACGLCVISFDCDTGPREIIRDGIDGMLVRPVADVQALASALSTVMSDKDLRIKYASQALSVRERFSMQKIGQTWDNLFTELGLKPSCSADKNTP